MDRNSPSYYIEETSVGCSDAEDFARHVLALTDVGSKFLAEVDKRSCMVENESPLSVAAINLDTKKEYSSVLNRKDTPIVMPVITPRFVPTCTEEMMKFLGDVSIKYGAFLLCSTLFCFVLRRYSSNLAFTFAYKSKTSAYQILSLLLSDLSRQRLTVLLAAVLLSYPVLISTLSLDTQFALTYDYSHCIMTHHFQLNLSLFPEGLPVQSHMSESMGEIDWVKSLHPEHGTYAEVYEACNLLHSKAYMAHCCHSSEIEIEVMRRSGARVVHCASSNFNLGSGVMDVRRFVEAGIPVALGTDVAGGHSPSMLDAIRQTIVASHCKEFIRRASSR